MRMQPEQLRLQASPACPSSRIWKQLVWGKKAKPSSPFFIWNEGFRVVPGADEARGHIVRQIKTSKMPKHPPRSNKNDLVNDSGQRHFLAWRDDKLCHKFCFPPHASTVRAVRITKRTPYLLTRQELQAVCPIQNLSSQSWHGECSLPGRG